MTVLHEKAHDGPVNHDRSPDYGCIPDQDAIGYIVVLSPRNQSFPTTFLVPAKDTARRGMFVTDGYPHIMEGREDADEMVRSYTVIAEQFGYVVSPHLRIMKLVAVELAEDEEITS